MKLYNTLSRKKENFKPITKGEVLFYQCGPTVYSTQHLGNMRAAVLADFIHRTFLYTDYKLKFTRNYTDVGHLTSDGDTGEDKIEKGVKKEGLSPKDITEKYINIFESDLADLNVLEPTFKPKATEFITEMQFMVKKLLDEGFAYITDLAVYFDVSKAKDYTRLSKQVMEDNIAHAGTGDTEDPQKKNPADFSLWFFKAGKHINALQFWPSPFTSKLVKNGEGFPGWHIECSAMSKTLLGDSIDVHMGGVEHIPVHHTNEIAQSESANKKPFVNYWLHNEHLLVNNAKMSKSEGTSYILADVKAKGFDPLALRYFFMQAHYRSKQNFTWEGLESARTGYDRLLKNVQALGDKAGEINTDFKKEFTGSITDDFNLPQALAIVFNILKSDLTNEDKLATVLDFDKVLGLNLKSKAEAKIEIPESIQKILKEREEARKNKDWKKSDELRDKILSLGYEVKDSAKGQEIFKK